jgi:hypothetical protein
MLVLDFHGFYATAVLQMAEDRIGEYANIAKKNVVSAYLHGSGPGEPAHDGGDANGWNSDGNGQNKAPGPQGMICVRPKPRPARPPVPAPAPASASPAPTHAPPSPHRLPRRHQEFPRPLFQRYKCFDSCSRSAAGCDKLKGCNCASCMSDLGFVAELLEELKASMCIDLDHIHVTGMSAGAIFVSAAAATSLCAGRRCRQPGVCSSMLLAVLCARES